MSGSKPEGAPRRAGRTAVVLAVLMAVAGPLCVYDHAREDTLSADEPIHLLAGLWMVERQNAIVNMEHPPLMKLLSGFSLARLALAPLPAQVPVGMDFMDWGRGFLFGNRVPVDAIVAAARAPFPILFGLLILLVFAAARRLWGAGPALFAAALIAFDPNLAAHAGVVHTDLGAALTFLAAILAWDSVLTRPSPARHALAAAALAAALLTKFSSVYLVAIMPLQALLLSRRQRQPGRALGKSALGFAVVTSGAMLLVLAIYAFVTARMDLAMQRAVIHEMVGLRGAPRLSGAIESLAGFSPPLAHYLGGLASVFQQNAVGGGVNFLNGQARTAAGFPQYFFVAFFAKSAPGFVVLAAVLLAALASGGAWARVREEARVFLVPVAVLFLASIGSSYNIGVRHLLPVYPLLALSGAGLFARLAPRRGAVLALALLPLCSAVELARIHPHELSYFNPFVGGPERGRLLLSDSNVDWGLELKRLAAEVRRRGAADPTVVYFGGDDVLFRMGVPDFASAPERRTPFVAVSAVQAAIGPAFYRYHGAPGQARALEALLADLARRGRHLGRVGYAFDLWELPQGQRGAAAATP
ncbi:MAG: glycosyltransferase family 39 protein [Thermoanaerobaculia bacterium]